MTGLSDSVPSLRRVDGRPFAAVSVASLAIGVAGALEVLVGYGLTASRLPGRVPDHFGPTGNVDGWMPPAEFLAVSLAVILGVTGLFTLVISGVARSPALVSYHGRGFDRPLLFIEACIVLVALPTTYVLLLLSAAGFLSVSPGTLALGTAAAGLVPLVAVAWVALRRDPDPPAPSILPGGSPEAPAHVTLGVGGAVDLLCSSCGETFRLAGVPLFAPHLGLAGQGSLYVRCPRCGERGWDRFIR